MTDPDIADLDNEAAGILGYFATYLLPDDTETALGWALSAAERMQDAGERMIEALDVNNEDFHEASDDYGDDWPGLLTPVDLQEETVGGAIGAVFSTVGPILGHADEAMAIAMVVALDLGVIDAFRLEGIHHSLWWLSDYLDRLGTAVTVLRDQMLELEGSITLANQVTISAEQAGYCADCYQLVLNWIAYFQGQIGSRLTAIENILNPS